jgi:thioredoxin 1
MVQLVINASDLATKLTDAKEKLVIIDFFARWCNLCKPIAPFVEKIANKYPDVKRLC